MAISPPNGDDALHRRRLARVARAQHAAPDIGTHLPIENIHLAAHNLPVVLGRQVLLHDTVETARRVEYKGVKPGLPAAEIQFPPAQRKRHLLLRPHTPPVRLAEKGVERVIGRPFVAGHDGPVGWFSGL